MTFALGAASQAHLQGVHPRLVAVVHLAIATTAQDFTVQQGLRSIAEEAQHVANGTSRTMNSKHLRQTDGYGHAVDLVPFVDGRAQWLWGEPADKDGAGHQVGGCYAIAAAVHQAAVQLDTAIRWGGVWDRPLFALCPNHLPGTPWTEVIATIRQAHLDYGARFEAANHRPALYDGPHFELA